MQMAALSRTFNVLPLEDAVERLMSGNLPNRAVSITFDDGYLDNLQVAIPVLKKYGLHATFFLTTGFLDGGLMYNDIVVESVRRLPGTTADLRFVGLGEVSIDDLESRVQLIHRLTGALKYLTPVARASASAQLSSLARGPLPDDLMMRSGDVRTLIQAGMSVGGHTVDHPILARTAPEDAYAQIVANRETLADLIGSTPRIFAYPNGKPGTDYGAEHVSMVRGAGYRFAVSTACGVATCQNDIYQLPRISPWDYKELPFIVHLLRLARMPADASQFPQSSASSQHGWATPNG
jgi:peptidoglycan/xylan/chitin deacetylase (PgdA/CDA1 family)